MSTPEDLYREKFSGYAPEPPQSVWQGVERGLRWRDFWSFRPLRMNIYYAVAALGAVIYGGYQLYGEQDDSQATAISMPARPANTASAPYANKPTAATAQGKSASEREVFPQTENNENTDTQYYANTIELMAPATGMPAEDAGNSAETVSVSAGSEYRRIAADLAIAAADEKASPPENTHGASAEANIRTQGQAAIMEARSSNARLSYVWSFGDGQSAVGQRATHKYRQPGTYSVRLVAFSKADNISDTIIKEVCISAPQYSITFPNAQVASLSATQFVPKGDVDCLVNYKLVIYSRNGQQVFATDNAQEGWNGYYKGDRLPKGVYVYRASYEFCSGERNTTGGSITLLWEENTNLMIHP